MRRTALSKARRCALLLSALACSPETEAPPASVESQGPLAVFAVNEPLRYFAERIGGEDVSVHFPAPRGVDPAHWFPDAETVAEYQEADLILLSGAGYAAWVQRASLPVKKLVDSSSAFSDRLIALEDGVVHQHGPEGEHSHSNTAFTVWLDPALAAQQAKAVAEALARARPHRAESFGERLAGLETELGVLDERLQAVARRLGGAPVVFSHPVYQYLARRYGLDGRSVHWEPDEPPDDGMWRQLDSLLAAHPAELMIWEDAPIEATARRLELRGVRSVVFAPCGNSCTEGDWLSVMERNAARLGDALPPSPGATADLRP